MSRRGYAKLKNDFYMNGKARQLRALCPSALGVFVFAISFCSDNLTDGYISARDLKYTLGATDEEIAALCEVGMLESDDGGYAIHDYTEHNSRRSQIEKKSEKNAEAYRKRTFSRDSVAIQTTESELNRTKHKNTRTQEPNTTNPPKAPQGALIEKSGDAAGAIREPSSEPNGEFERFWAVYPNHDYPDAAIREFRRVRRKRVSLAALVQGARLLAGERREARYVPSARKWLHDGGWANTPKPKPPGMATRNQRAQAEWDEDRRIREQIAEETGKGNRNAITA